MLEKEAQDRLERLKNGYIIYSVYSNNYRILHCDGSADKDIGFSSKIRNGEPTTDNLDATYEIAVNPSSIGKVRDSMASMIKEKFTQELLSINKILSYLGQRHLTKEELINSVAGKPLE